MRQIARLLLFPWIKKLLIFKMVVAFAVFTGFLYANIQNSDPDLGWFHQHFNTGSEKARQLALRYGSKKHKMGFYVAAQKRDGGVFISVKEGGTLIEYEDEDPEIRRIYEAELNRRGIRCDMPPLR